MKISLSNIIIGIVCLLVGLFFTLSSWEAYSEYKRVQDYSGRAIGHITKKYFQTAADGGGNYYLDYEFMSSAGSKISAGSIIAKQQWDMFQVDNTLEIRFDRSNPHRNIPMVGGSPSLVWAFFMLAMGLVFMVFGVSRFLTSFKKQKSSA
ncbi:MAG TPA: hypothetical protein PLP18_02735 [Smithellaceae bacterium]|nr:hypothetical protein [Smithellaceae bacterium]